jgi:SAM-dependent methyltransferase
MEEWHDYARRNPSVGNPENGADLAKRIMRTGFREPLTGRTVIPAEIVSPDMNWREGLRANGLNSRMRAVLALIAEATASRSIYDTRIFSAEGLTPFALLMRGIFPQFLGSEYLPDAADRAAMFPIPHQDLMALDLPSSSFEFVSTNEVMEHIPDIDAALREIVRILKPGGMHIGTFPFRFWAAGSQLQARLVDGRIQHLIEKPEYHGNPVDPERGSLVFETPGWDIIERAHLAGFSDAAMRFVASEAHGYVTENTGVFVFCARR